MAHFNGVVSCRKIAESCLSIVWGNDAGAFLFAALLIACSLTVGCSSDKPKPVNYTNSNPVTQTPSAIASSIAPAPAPQTESKPAPKQDAKKRPATVHYSDNTNGVSFQYPPQYTIATADATTVLVATNTLPIHL